MRRAVINIALIFVSVFSFSGIVGCQSFQPGGSILSRSLSRPGKREIVRGQLVIHSDFHIPRRHRLMDELTMRRQDVSELLQIPVSEEPIHVYLFENEAAFNDYMKRKHPLFPNRRAFFVKSDTALMVYAYWGNRVAEDLRHEVTHGYLHSCINDLPLWLDEGLAEYFETPRVNRGFNSPHFHLLLKRYDANQWQPDLARLESLKNAARLTQMDYAESWLWVHYLLHHNVQSAGILQQHLEDVRVDPASAKSLEDLLEAAGKDQTEILSHLEFLRSSLNASE